MNANYKSPFLKIQVYLASRRSIGSKYDAVPFVKNDMTQLSSVDWGD